MKPIVLSLLILALISLSQAQPQAGVAGTEPSFDVIHYNLQLEPDIDRKSVSGKVSIKFAARKRNLTEIELNCGELTIDAVREKGTRKSLFAAIAASSSRCPVRRKLNQHREIEIDYHGTPRFGIRFFPDRQQVYTIFSTSQWMVCVDAPDDRATFNLTLILPAKLTGVANGRLVAQRPSSEQQNLF